MERARAEDRSLVRTWAMRQTMHLIATDDFAWLVPLFAGRAAAFSRRRLAHFGVDPRTQDRGLERTRELLTAEGPLSRTELAAHLERRGIALTAQTRMHLFMLAVNSGIAVLGPERDGQTCLVLERDWLGERPPHDREAALAELARRYLRAFGPATEADFAGWAGLGLGEVRAGLAAIGGELREVRIGSEPAFTLRKRLRAARGRVVRLLPGWDTYLMGHRDRDFLATGEDWRQVVPGGGILRPSIVVDGALAGTWTSKRQGKRLQIQLQPFTKPDGDVLAHLKAEVEDIGRFEATAAEWHVNDGERYRVTPHA